MIIDYSTQNGAQKYNLMGSSVIPRPIAWISTKNEDESVNLAPFSYFTPLSSSPATLIVSIGHKKNGALKDTLKNLRRTKKCTINISSPEFLKELHQSSFSYEYNESEIEKIGIEIKDIKEDYPPIVKGVPTAFFCDFHSTVSLDGKTIPTIVEIKGQYLDDSIVKLAGERYNIDFEPLARIAREYATLGERITTPPFD
jgi:flavin reductase (DIM6/NTAB) family NADH-FMN oxidoreductase RutF